MSKSFLLLTALLVIFGLALSACGGAAPAVEDLAAEEQVFKDQTIGETPVSPTDIPGIEEQIKPSNTPVSLPTETDIPVLSIPTVTINPEIPPDCTQIGQTWTSPQDGMVLSCIPAGEFLMGSKEGDADALDNEFPQHGVYLDAYGMDQTEVTDGMYQLCVADGNCDLPADTKYYNNASYADHPVAYVTWYQAEDYCTWAGRRLPTEAEWEKAARGEDGRIYPWGNEFDCHKGNFDDETTLDDYVVPGGAGCDGFDQTAPVGSFINGVSTYGLLDMAGNVYEWVMDWYQDNYYANSPSDNPQGPASGEYRVLRGGSWFNLGYSGYLRSAFRIRYNSDFRSFLLGFRCARGTSP